MARRSGVLAALAFGLALGPGLAWPAGAAAAESPMEVVSVFYTPPPSHVQLTSTPLNESVSLVIEVITVVPVLNGVTVIDQLPAGLVVAGTPDVQTVGWSTVGSVTAVPGSSTISLTGFGVSLENPGLVYVDVTGTSPGTKTDDLSAICSGYGTATDVLDGSIDVVAPPSISTAFDPGSLSAPGGASLQFSIANPAGNDVALANVGFSDALPAGLSVGSSSASQCGGTLTTGSGSIALAGASIAVDSACTFSVEVSSSAIGYYTVTTQAGSDNGGTGNTSTANLSVGYSAPIISAAFGASSIPAGGSATLSFTITNPNTNSEPLVRPAVAGVMTLSGVRFTDTLPTGLAIASPNGLTGSCGSGTITAASGSGSISLTGATLAAGTSCTFSVLVTGTSAGSYQDSTGPVSSTEGGSGAASQTGITVTGAASSPAPTGAATPPPTSTGPTSTPAGSDAGLLLALCAGLVLAACLVARSQGFGRRTR